MDNRAGVLSGEEIAALGLIENADTDRYQTCSYDLRLGDRHYVFDESGKWKAYFLGSSIDLAKANQNMSQKGEKYIFQLPERDPNKLEIPAFGSAVIEIAETVNTLKAAKDNNLLLVGRFDLKLKAIYKGLISQQATQVEPCYKGKLYCFIHNLTARAIELRIGEPVATIEFLYAGQGMDEDCRKTIINETKLKNAEKYEGDEALVFLGEGIKDIRWLYEKGQLPLECGLAPINSKVNSGLEEEIKSYMERGSTISEYSKRVGSAINEQQNVVKLIFSLVVAVISLVGTYFGSSILQQLRFFEEELALLEAQLYPELSKEAIAAINAHTAGLNAYREQIWSVLVIAAVVTAIASLVIYRLTGESRWKRKNRRILAKEEYKSNKKRIKEAAKKAREERDATRRDERIYKRQKQKK